MTTRVLTALAISTGLALTAVSGLARAASAEWDALVKAAQMEGAVEVILGGQMPRKLRTAMPAFTQTAAERFCAPGRRKAF